MQGRIIKFRAWINKIGVYAENCIINSDGGYIAYKNGVQYLNCEIEQYTGLKDKNGKEIYEGDIIDCGIRNLPYVVDWIDKYCMFFPFGKEKIMMEVYNSGNEIKVIGNIHENPELLNG